MDWRERLTGMLLTAYLAVVVALLVIPLVMIVCAAKVWDRVVDWLDPE